MDGFEGWIIGTVFLWLVTYICVNPVAHYIATYRLRKTREPSYERKVDPQSIPDRYFMFSGALIFTLLGFLVGLLFGTYFIGLSWKKRHLPGVAALILASFTGLLFNAPESYDFAFLLLIVASLISVATGAAVMLQTPQMLRWEGEVSVTRPQMQPSPARSPQPVRGTLIESRICPSCGNVNRLGDRFCRKCGTPLPTVPTTEKAYCTKCGTELKKSAGFCHSCGQAVSRITSPREAIPTVEKVEKPLKMMKPLKMKKPWLAALLNLILPGLGFIYLGRILSVVGGIILVVITLAMNISPVSWILIGAGVRNMSMWTFWALFVWMPIGAYVAKRRNRKMKEKAETKRE